MLLLRQTIVDNYEFLDYALEYQYSNDGAVQKVEDATKHTNPQHSTQHIQKQLPKIPSTMEQQTSAIANNNGCDTNQELGYMQKAAIYLDQQKIQQKMDKYNVQHDNDMFTL